MARYLMKCGCVDNAIQRLPNGKEIPCCVIHDTTEILREVQDTDGLEGRMAKCPDCGRTVPSKWSLAFFQYRGASSERALLMCKCGYYKKAHEDDPTNLNRNVIKEGKCKGFEPHGAYEFDSYYCGCRGWD